MKPFSLVTKPRIRHIKVVDECYGSKTLPGIIITLDQPTPHPMSCKNQSDGLMYRQHHQKTAPQAWKQILTFKKIDKFLVCLAIFLYFIIYSSKVEDEYNSHSWEVAKIQVYVLWSWSWIFRGSEVADKRVVSLANLHMNWEVSDESIVGFVKLQMNW